MQLFKPLEIKAMLILPNSSYNLLYRSKEKYFKCRHRPIFSLNFFIVSLIVPKLKVKRYFSKEVFKLLSSFLSKQNEFCPKDREIIVLRHQTFVFYECGQCDTI